MAQFPIESPDRQLLMALELVIIFFSMEIAIYFFQKYWNNKKNEVPSYVELDWGILFLSYSITNVWFIFSAYYAFPQFRINFLLLGYLSIAIGGLFFTYHIESRKIINSRGVFTVFSSAVTAMLFLTYFTASSILQTLATLSMVPAYGLLFFYFLMVCKKLWKGYKIQSISLFVGISSWLIGYAGTSDAMINLFGGFYIRIYADILIITAMGVISFFLNQIPSLSEIGWQQRIKYIILLSRSGICLYHENFREKREMSDIILAGAISGIKSFMEATLKSQPKLKVISKEKDTFIIEEGKYIIGTVIADQELEILKYLLRKIINQFEEFFKDILQNWIGVTDVFKPAKNIINSILAIEKYI